MKVAARITAIAGRARDLDVFAMQTLPAMAKAAATPLDDPGLARRLHAARRRARMELVDAIASPRFARAVLGMGRLVRAPSARGSHEPLDRFCASRLGKVERAVRREADGFAALDAAARHRLRIRAKRLRYALDACGGLFGAKRVKRYTSVLSELQDALGDANDARIAAALVAELRAGRAWRNAAGPGLEAMETEAIRRAAPCVERLRSLALPWRKH